MDLGQNQTFFVNLRTFMAFLLLPLIEQANLGSCKKMNKVQRVQKVTNQNILDLKRESGGGVPPGCRPPNSHAQLLSDGLVLNDVGDGHNEHKLDMLLNRMSKKHPAFSVVEKIDAAIAVGQALGWDMTGCVNTLQSIITDKGDVLGNQ